MLSAIMLSSFFVVTFSDALSVLLYRSQVTTAWQWHAFLASRVTGGRQLLRLNLDETAVAYWDTKKNRGNLYIGGPRGVRRALRAKATLAQLRMHITHVAVVCDDTSIQPLLPQILLVSTHTLPAYKVDEVAAELGPNVEIWRERSAWVNAVVFRRIIIRIGEALAHLRGSHAFILSMDTFAAHFDSAVLRAAARARLWVCPVPARTTCKMQVLDTHGFAKYKDLIQSEYGRFLYLLL